MSDAYLSLSSPSMVAVLLITLNTLQAGNSSSIHYTDSLHGKRLFQLLWIISFEKVLYTMRRGHFLTYKMDDCNDITFQITEITNSKDVRKQYEHSIRTVLHVPTVRLLFCLKEWTDTFPHLTQCICKDFVSKILKCQQSVCSLTYLWVWF